MKAARDTEPGEKWGDLVRRPSAFVPLLCSVAALAVLAAHLALHGATPEADEGAAAHLWQLLMAGQVPVVLFFAVRWVPRAPRAALAILGVQLVAAVGAALPVFCLGL